MKTRHLKFKPQFIPLILAGVKKSTIRPKGKIESHVGDTMIVEKWEGRPYWTAVLRVAQATITAVSEITVHESGCIRDGAEMQPAELESLASIEGFESWRFGSWPQMRAWFREVHKTHLRPFNGVQLQWEGISKL